LLKILLKFFVELTGSPFMSRRLMAVTKAKSSRKMISLFAQVYNVNQEEMEIPLPEYTSLQHFFTRTLKAGMRPVEAGENIFVSPVDGVVNAFGSIQDVMNYTVKNKPIMLEEMMGSAEKAAKYKNGKYIIFYLSPRHYHRIHSPVKGRKTPAWTLGGKSYPVNRFGIKHGRRPLSTNFRTITEIQSRHQQVAVVKVGALNVNSIHLTHSRQNIEPGEELAYFSFGSTVILLIENENFQFSSVLCEGMEIKYGEKIGFISA